MQLIFTFTRDTTPVMVCARNLTEAREQFAMLTGNSNEVINTAPGWALVLERRAGSRVEWEVEW